MSRAADPSSRGTKTTHFDDTVIMTSGPIRMALMTSDDILTFEIGVAVVPTITEQSFRKFIFFKSKKGIYP